mmetsp:Transcript_15491/g.19818  ORF Transcript_15491/g.19818 Transcript_15491/m.19818 type:complete len:555 (-) Transcript_15491:30-1694(-)
MSGLELYDAVGTGAFMKVKKLVKQGVDVNFWNPTDSAQEAPTPLMQASTQGRAMIARVLLDGGAQIDAQGSTGCSALSLGCYYGHVDVVKLLLDRGANPFLEVHGGEAIGGKFDNKVPNEQQVLVQDLIDSARRRINPTASSCSLSANIPPEPPSPSRIPIPVKRGSLDMNPRVAAGRSKSNSSIGKGSASSDFDVGDIDAKIQVQGRVMRPLMKELLPLEQIKTGSGQRPSDSSHDSKTRTSDTLSESISSFFQGSESKARIRKVKSTPASPGLLCGSSAGTVFKKCFCGDMLNDIVADVDEYDSEEDEMEANLELASPTRDSHQQNLGHLKDIMKQSGSYALRKSLSDSSASASFQERGVLVIRDENIMGAPEDPDEVNTVFRFNATTINEVELPLEVFSSFPVIIVVNVASQCGYAHSNYIQLQSLYDKYHERGLEILAFPCNQFAKQEPWPNSQIKEYVVKKYKVSFPLFAKIEVNGHQEHPLFAFIKKRMDIPHILWNFTKFLVVNGSPVKFYTHNMRPQIIEEDVEEVFKIFDRRKEQDSSDERPKFY